MLSFKFNWFRELSALCVFLVQLLFPLFKEMGERKEVHVQLLTHVGSLLGLPCPENQSDESCFHLHTDKQPTGFGRGHLETVAPPSILRIMDYVSLQCQT